MFHFPISNFLGKKDEASSSTSSTTKPPPYGFGWNDHYQYPTLYEEADEMLHVSLLIYSITDLRSLARNPKRAGDLISPEKVLQLPLTFHTCLESIEENFDTIQKEFGDQQHANTMSSLQIIQRRYESSAGSGGSGGGGGIRQWTNPFASSKDGSVEIQTLAPCLTSFGDENPDNDMVYAVGVDPTRKRITVAFRGSVTPTDFLKDAMIAFSIQPNPVRDGDKGHIHEKIGIHQGFYDYLLRPRSKGGRNKFEEIIAHVKSLFLEVPERQKEYKLYVTGHSLGGALTTLFSLYAAASLEEPSNVIPKPVCCFSVASPRVGDYAFQHAFSRLEELGLVRHLRIANDRDPVTVMPTASGKKIWATLSPVSYLAFKLMDNKFEEKETFRHTGIKLLLAKDVCQLSYMGQSLLAAKNDDGDSAGNDNDQDSVSTGSTKSLTRSQKRRRSVRKDNIPDVAFHLGVAYTENLASVKSDLVSLSLNDLYTTSVVRIVAEKDSQVE